MGLLGGGGGLSREQKVATAANAGVADRAGVLGDYYAIDQQRRNQAYDSILLYGLGGGGGNGTGVRNVTGGTVTGGLFGGDNWGAGTYGNDVSTPASSQDYYTTKDPQIEVSKISKMISPNDFDKFLRDISRSPDQQTKRQYLDNYLRQSGATGGIAQFSTEAVDEFLKNPVNTSSVPSDISVKNFRKSGVANQIAGQQVSLLDPKKYYDYVMGSPGGQNMARFTTEMAQLRNREGALYEDWKRTAEKGQKERYAAQMKETSKEIERLQGRQGTGVNRGRAAALKDTAARELAATAMRDWDEFLADFTERSQVMYMNSVEFATNWTNNLGELRSSTIAARDNLLNYRFNQLQMEYRNNENWFERNPRQEAGGAAMTMIGGIMSAIGMAAMAIPGLQPVGMGLAAGTAMAGGALSSVGNSLQGAQGGSSPFGPLETGLNIATRGGTQSLFGGGTRTSTGGGSGTATPGWPSWAGDNIRPPSSLIR